MLIHDKKEKTKQGLFATILCNGELIDAETLYSEIYNFGNRLLKIRLKGNLDYPQMLFIRDNMELIKKYYDKLINKYPYLNNINLDTLIDNSFYIALVDRIYSYSKQISNSKDIYDFDPNILLDLLTLLDYDDYMEVDDDYSNFISMLYKINSPKNNYDLADIFDTTKHGINKLSLFLTHILQVRINEQKYIIECNHIEFVDKEPVLYTRANNIYSIVFNRLLLKIVGFETKNKYKQCTNPECCDFFIQNTKGKVLYCPSCRKANIPSKLKNKKYNKYKRNRTS